MYDEQGQLEDAEELEETRDVNLEQDGSNGNGKQDDAGTGSARPASKLASPPHDSGRSDSLIDWGCCEGARGRAGAGRVRWTCREFRGDLGVVLFVRSAACSFALRSRYRRRW